MSQPLSQTFASHDAAPAQSTIDPVYDDGLPSRPQLMLAFALTALSGAVVGLAAGILFF